ncbi:MAG: mechanosensitive ion channel [Alphaproteobacteria bacterium]|nr:mechanosensitive ion channel [Alphaproteobacteria bacterium]
MQQELEMVTKLADSLVEFAVAYGFQILGALVFLLVGLKVAGWLGGKVARIAEARDMDQTLSRFIGNIVKLVIIVLVAIITLGNFGISTAPLIALAGASAFGATLALQGPLSNYGAGLSIILTRPFAIGDTITVKNVSGTVEEITLAATVLIGEDGEQITVPNKEIVGEIIVNSHEHRVVETRIAIPSTENAEQAMSVLRRILQESREVGDLPKPQVGIHDFTYGGVVVGLRFWVPGQQYFQTRYAVNETLMRGLRDAGIGLMPAMGTAVAAEKLSADAEA